MGTEVTFVTLPTGYAHCAMQQHSKHPGTPLCPSSLAPGTDWAGTCGLAGSEDNLPESRGRGEAALPSPTVSPPHLSPAPSSIFPPSAGRGILHVRVMSTSP